MSGLVPLQDKCLEDAFDVLTKTVSYVLGSQVVLVELVRDEIVFYAGFVQKACSVGLFYLFCNRSI